MYWTISGTTDASGILAISIPNTFHRGVSYVLSDISNTLNRPWHITIEGTGETWINFRFRSIIDNSAVANTEIPATTVLIIGK